MSAAAATENMEPQVTPQSSTASIVKFDRRNLVTADIQAMRKWLITLHRDQVATPLPIQSGPRTRRVTDLLPDLFIRAKIVLSQKDFDALVLDRLVHPVDPKDKDSRTWTRVELNALSIALSQIRDAQRSSQNCRKNTPTHPLPATLRSCLKNMIPIDLPIVIKEDDVLEFASQHSSDESRSTTSAGEVDDEEGSESSTASASIEEDYFLPPKPPSITPRAMSLLVQTLLQRVEALEMSLLLVKQQVHRFPSAAL